MRISRAGILFLAVTVAVSGSSCSVYNSVMARKNVVDGAEAFKGRKFPDAEALFRTAVNRAPDGSKEQKTAQLFLARTLHSEFAANRQLTEKATQAIEEYKKVLATDPADNASFKAVANLYDSLGQTDDWRKWVTDRANNAQVPAEQRAEAYTSLAAKENTCANDITELPAVKKTVIKDGKATYTFSKPENAADIETLKGCINKGTDLVNKALELDKNNESVWSYKTSLLVQSMRLAEMEGRMPDKDRFKAEADTAKAEFTRLAEISRKKREEEEARKKAEEAAAKGETVNTNTNTQ